MDHINSNIYIKMIIDEDGDDQFSLSTLLFNPASEEVGSLRPITFYFAYISIHVTFIRVTLPFLVLASACELKLFY